MTDNGTENDIVKIYLRIYHLLLKRNFICLYSKIITKIKFF